MRRVAPPLVGGVKTAVTGAVTGVRSVFSFSASNLIAIIHSRISRSVLAANINGLLSDLRACNTMHTPTVYRLSAGLSKAISRKRCKI